MKKQITFAQNASAFLTAFILLFSLALNSQPCDPAPNGIPAGNAPPGCTLCLPTYSGTNAGSGPNGPSPSCWGVQNNVFINVIADMNGMISATVLPSNCQSGNGLHLMIMDQSLNFVSNCLVGGGGLPQTVMASGLIPGETYYIMIDGWAADVCDFLLTVSGTTAGGPLPPPGNMTATPDTSPICPGTVVCYEIPPVPGALAYEWDIPTNGQIVSGGGVDDTEVCIEYLSPGGGVVQVAATNFCFPGIPAITPVAVLPVLPTVLPPEFVCEADFPISRDGQLFTQTGATTVTFITALGCDSNVTYTFLPLVQVPNVIDTSICSGDIFKVGNMEFDSSGSYRIEMGSPYAQANGCDSLVLLALTVLEPVVNIAPPPPLDCDPTSTVCIDGSASSSGNNVTFQWTSLTPGGCIIPPLNMNTVKADAPGDVEFCVTQLDTLSGKSCTLCDTVTITRSALPLAAPIFTLNPNPVCESSQHIFSVAPVNNATGYTWEIPSNATINGSGTSVTIDFNSPGTGVICVTAQGDCGDSPQTCVPVVVNPIPTGDFTSTSPICITDESTVTYVGNASTGVDFLWNFNGGSPAVVSGPGPHNISWATPGLKNITLVVEENGCTSLQESQSVQVDPELIPPVINCTSTPTSVTFDWNPIPGATGYNVSINGNPPILQTGISIVESGLSPNESVSITVEAIGTTACGSSSTSTTCVAQNCPSVSLNIVPISDICLESSTVPINLNFSPSGGAGGGTHTWSGPGVTGNSFNPQAGNLGTNIITLEYTEGTCIYTGSLSLNVFNIPDANFTSTSPICILDNSLINYSGAASAGANYSWDFGGGSIISGTDRGPYEINWTSPGTQTVSLTVEENGCTSDPISQQIQIDPELSSPIISCISSTTTEIVFGWSLVPGATNYIINGPGVVDQSNQTVTVNGLSAGDEITIEVVAEGNSACGSSRASGRCISLNCPPTTVDFSQIGPFCKDGAGGLIPLKATAGDNSGSFIWSGPGVVQPNMFDINAASVNPGLINLKVTYTMDNCSYENTMQVMVNGQPSSDFIIEEPICKNESSTISYSGTASGTAIYNWDFGAGNVLSGTGFNNDPYEVNWSTSGMQTVSLTVIENNCASQLNSQNLRVDEPLDPVIITCDPDQNSINFNWNPIPNALTYDVELLSGTQGVFDGTLNYDISGLTPGDVAEIAVTVTGTTICGPVRDTLLCEAKDCPDYSVAMPFVSPLCLDGTVSGFSLDSLLSVVDIAGMNLKDQSRLRWHDGSDNNDYITTGGTFFPTAAGANFGTGAVPIALEIEYPLNSGCLKTFTTTIELNPIPSNNILVDKDSLCITDQAIAGLTAGSNDPNAVFDWDFGNANILSGNGQGPYELSWNQPGTDTLKLTITEKGCVSDEILQPIQIDEEINPFAANLRCNPTNTGNTMIEFEWDLVQSVDNYQTNILSTNISPPPSPTTSTSTSEFFGGLSPNDSITLEIILTDDESSCPPVTATATCKAKQCPQTIVEIQPVTDTCLLITGQTSIQLSSIISNDPTNLSGISSWAGTDVTATGLFTPQSEGIYNLSNTYTSDGCTFNDNITIRMFETPIAEFTVEPIICQNDFASISFTGNAPAGAVFTWAKDGGTFSGTDRDPQTIDWMGQTGLKNISLNIDNSGCQSQSTINQVQIDPSLEDLIINCNGPNGTTSSIDFNWNSDPNVTEYEVFVETPFGSNNFVSNGVQLGTDFLLEGLTPGIGQGRIRVVARGNTICPEKTSDFDCRVKPCPGISLDFSPIPPLCIDADAVTVSVTPIGGNGITISTISGNGYSAGEFSPSDAGIGTHTLTAEYNEAGCITTNTLEITVNPLPNAEAGEMKRLSCDAELVQIGSIDTPENLNYQWLLNGNAIGNQRLIDVDSGGTFTLIVTDPITGCSNTDEVFVDASFSNPMISAEVNEITCFGRNDGAITITGMLDGVPPFEYSFNGSDFSTDDFFPNLGPGIYNITGKDANGCESDVSFQIIEPDDLTVEIVITAGENPVEFPDSIQLSAVTNYAPSLLSSVDWSPEGEFTVCDETNITNCLTAWVTPSGQTVYSVRVENINGCVDSDNLTVEVLKNYPAYIPSAFSPANQDGINDILQVFGDSKIIKEVKSFLIFDRWGNLLFENYNFQPAAGPDPNNGWDGRFKGKMLDSGVYIYFAEVEFTDGLIDIFKGDVTLK